MENLSSWRGKQAILQMRWKTWKQSIKTTDKDAWAKPHTAFIKLVWWWVKNSLLIWTVRLVPVMTTWLCIYCARSAECQNLLLWQLFSLEALYYLSGNENVVAWTQTLVNMSHFIHLSYASLSCLINFILELAKARGHWAQIFHKFQLPNLS